MQYPAYVPMLAAPIEAMYYQQVPIMYPYQVQNSDNGPYYQNSDETDSVVYPPSTIAENEPKFNTL
jgi:hypothetical protein